MFEFHEGEFPEHIAITLDSRVTPVILEGIRRVDEWQRIRAVFPNMETTFKVNGPPPSGADPVEKQVLALAAAGKSLAEMSLELRRSDFETASLVFDLHARGLLAVGQVRAETQAADPVGAIQALLALAYQRLQEKRYDAAMKAYEDVLVLDRLNQNAKKGLIATMEARQRERQLHAMPRERVPSLAVDLATLTKQNLDPHEGFVLSRVNVLVFKIGATFPRREELRMEEKKEILKKKEKEKDLPDPKDYTTCEATAQMITKARREGVEIAFDRAHNMKPCPIGAESACCKHCFMGPCRLNARDPYSKVGVCGATIDTIQSRNFARAVAAGCAAHTDHGMSMVDLFREVVNGHIKDYRIKNPAKLEAVAQSIGIETEGRDVMDIARDLYTELERTYTRWKARFPLPSVCRRRLWRPGASTASSRAAPCAKSWN